MLLQRNGNMAIDCLDDVHPDVAYYAVLAAKIVGLDIAGMDMIAEGVPTTRAALGLAARAGIELVRIPYGGAAPSLAALGNNDVQLGVENVAARLFLGSQRTTHLLSAFMRREYGRS